MRVYKYANYDYITIAEIPLSEIERIDMDLCKQPSETPDTYYRRVKVKPDIICNLGLFNMSNGQTCQTFINDGETVNIEAWLADGIGIRDAKDIAFGRYTDAGWRDFINGYPVLVRNYAIQPVTYAKELNYSARRTAIGFNDSTLYVVCVDNPGTVFEFLSRVMLDIGCQYAIAVDGGGSTRMLYKGVAQTSQTWVRSVDNVFCVYLKKTIYRVQCGAFKSQTNAERLKKQIQSIHDTINAGYANAYIRVIDGLYKVQIGAFGNKANADRVLADMKSKGFNPFITTQ